MSKAPSLQVEEIGGDQYPDLDAARRAALPSLADSLQAVILNLLESGKLIKTEDGKIIPNPEG